MVMKTLTIIEHYPKALCKLTSQTEGGVPTHEVYIFLNNFSIEVDWSSLFVAILMRFGSHSPCY